jgi:hypothetical protein
MFLDTTNAINTKRYMTT